MSPSSRSGIGMEPAASDTANSAIMARFLPIRLDTAVQTQKDFQGVRNLPFCYLCGRDFVATDAVDWDHVPAKSAFSPRDHDPPLKLKTHRETCHAQWSDNDKKVGQLISLRRGEGPKSQRDQALRFIQHGDMVDRKSTRLNSSHL